MIKKNLVALFLDTSATETPTYTRVTKSTELTIELNPEVKTYSYIADESSTDELDSYSVKIAQDLNCYKDDAIFEMIFDRMYNLSTGSQATVKAMVVFMFEKLTTPDDTYKAWFSQQAMISINDYNAVEGVINFDISFGGNIKTGTATITAGTPVFTEV